MVLQCVEDVVQVVCEHLHEGRVRDMLPDDWFLNFLNNIQVWVSDGKPLTTEQAKIVLKILGKTRPLFLSLGVSAKAIREMQTDPVYRQQPTLSSVMPREVRYLGGNILGFRFKRNDTIVNDIKALKKNWATDDDVVFDYVQRLWIVRVTGENMTPMTEDGLTPIMKIIAKHRFAFDDEVAGFLADSENVTGGETAFSTTECMILDNDLVGQWVRAVLIGETR